MTHKIKCPKCGEIEQVEITKTWGGTLVPNNLMFELYCNTCGKVSIVSGTEGHTSSAK